MAQKRPLAFLVIHTTATKKGLWISEDAIRRWHTAPPPVGQGWDRVGYSKLIKISGNMPTNMQDVYANKDPNCIIYSFVRENEDEFVDPWEITYGAAEYNPVSLHICYVGGLSADLRTPEDTRTEAQKSAMEFLVRYYIQKIGEERGHKFYVCGHNQLQNKACPSFWVPSWLESIGIPEKYIYRKDPFGYKKYFEALARKRK